MSLFRSLYCNQDKRVDININSLPPRVSIPCVPHSCTSASSAYESAQPRTASKLGQGLCSPRHCRRETVPLNASKLGGKYSVDSVRRCSVIFRVQYVAVRWVMRTVGRAHALLGATALGRSTFALIQHRSEGMLYCTAVRFSLLSVLGLQMESMKSKHGDYNVSHTKQRGLLGEGMRLTMSDSNGTGCKTRA